MPSIVLIGSSRKYRTAFAFAVTLILFGITSYLLFAGSVAPAEFYALILLIVISIVLGIFSLIKSKRKALVATLVVLLVPIAFFLIAILWSLFAPQFFGANVSRLKALQTDGVLSCRIAGHNFHNGEGLSESDEAGGANVFDGGTHSTRVYREINLGNADPNNVMDALTACAQANGWIKLQRTKTINHDPELDGSKTFPGGWTATMTLDINMHPQDMNAGQSYGPPIIEITLETDAV